MLHTMFIDYHPYLRSTLSPTFTGIFRINVLQCSYLAAHTGSLTNLDTLPKGLARVSINLYFTNEKSQANTCSF